MTRAVPGTSRLRPLYTYERWLASLGLPIYSGHYIEDLRALLLGRWDARGCDVAFIQLAGEEGIVETRVSEVPPQAVQPPTRLAFDEVVYVLQGRGATTVWRPGDDNDRRKSFEWQTNSLFLLPRQHVHQFSNTHGSQPARLLHYNYLPLAMSAIPEPTFFFPPLDEPLPSTDGRQPVDLEAFYAEPTLRREAQEGVLWGRRREAWVGSFFPDMSRWHELENNYSRGAGGRSVFIEFPGSELTCHMSVFPPRTYKKAHRHGPGRAIVIPAGEGYSVLWEEGKEKVIAPWKPGSMITPPDRWFHQHFNVGPAPARYLALHPPMQFYGHAEKIEDRARDQIEYPDEEPWIRERFEAELAKRGLTSLVPPEAYARRDYDWKAEP